MYYFLCAYIFVPLYMFTSMLFLWSQLTDASLLCKLFYLLLLWMYTRFDVLAASDLSKESLKPSAYSSRRGRGGGYMKNKGWHTLEISYYKRCNSPRSLRPAFWNSSFHEATQCLSIAETPGGSTSGRRRALPVTTLASGLPCSLAEPSLEHSSRVGSFCPNHFLLLSLGTTCGLMVLPALLHSSS